jgi:iron complex transport system permease protein
VPAEIQHQSGRRRAPIGLVVAFVAVIGSMVAALATGPSEIPLSDIGWSALHHVATAASRFGFGIPIPADPLDQVANQILWQGRAPRIAAAGAIGAGLAACGAALQGVTGNALADPYLLGLSSGAALGTVAALLLATAVPVSVAAFAGAMTALLASLVLSGNRHGAPPARAILAGVAVGQTCTALASFIIFSNAKGDAYREILAWLMGSVAGTDWTGAATVLGTVCALAPVVLVCGRAVDAMAFGDTTARSLGVNTAVVRWILLAATAITTGLLVSIGGSIGFVGLALPHILRLIGFHRSTLLTAMSFPSGAVFLILADTLARTAFAPQEVPVGIVTAAIGAPVLMFLLARRGVVG